MNPAPSRDAGRVSIRRLRAGETTHFRDIRLRALKDAPLAFGESVAEARKRPKANWEHAASRFSRGSTGAVFIADDGRRWVGMIGIRASDDEPELMWIWGMWVDPRVRRTGVASRLIDRAVAWAGRQGAARIRLGVFKENTDAYHLYRGLGFRPGRLVPATRFPGRFWRTMTRALRD